MDGFDKRCSGKIHNDCQHLSTAWPHVVSVTHQFYAITNLMMLAPSLCSYLTILTHAPWGSISTDAVITLQIQYFYLKSFSVLLS